MSDKYFACDTMEKRIGRIGQIQTDFFLELLFKPKQNQKKSV
jgi:hypothetical protein